MHVKILTAALAFSSIISANALFADTSSVAKFNDDPQAVFNYWTPERMQNAKEKFYPQVDVSKIRPEVVNQKKLGEGEDGHPPTIQLKPDMTPIFKPLLQDNSPVSTMNAGTRNEHFSSSRLVPLSADLSFPYRAIGKLFFTEPGQGNFVCSASVIKPRVVLTAGHCVHAGSGGVNGYFTNFLFVPAFRDGAAPFQSWSWAFVQTTPDWMTGGGGVPNAADYGMIETVDKVISGNTTKIGTVTGWLGYQLNSLIPNHAHLIGYPCNHDSCQKMHQVAAQSAVAVSPNNVEYGSDMRGGSSGGPWVQNFGEPAVGQTGGINTGVNRVVGVTSWGYTNAALMGQGASIFDNRFTTLLNAVCAHKAGNC